MAAEKVSQQAQADSWSEGSDSPELPRLWETPFVKGEDGDSEVLQTHPDRKIWSDLLLDISMTTAFNSLTNGTDILNGETCVSYLLFFALVWWIWVSQVAYDIRFTKGDWIHRVSVFLQFIVFCALAAFTKDFNIGFKLTSGMEEAAAASAQLRDGFTIDEIDASRSREDLIPLMNARGISVVMVFSRLLLLSQYLITLCQAATSKQWTSPKELVLRCWREASLRSIRTHVISLIISALFYLTSFIILRTSHGSDKSTQIIKIILWYFPPLFEATMHFLATTQPGHVFYPMDRVFERSAAIFVIILGGGLDKITEGFQLIAGNVSLSKTGIWLMLSAAIIIIAQFSLYFEMTKGNEITKSRKSRPFCRRVVAWFFFQLVFHAALIIMLQAIASLLSFGNIATALGTPLSIRNDAEAEIIQAGSGRNISDNSFQNLQYGLENLGIVRSDIVSYINDAINVENSALGDESNPNTTLGVGTNNESFDTPALSAARNAALQYSIVAVSAVLDNFDAGQGENSWLQSNISLFLDQDPTDMSINFEDDWSDIMHGILISKAKPAMWFFGSAGMTVLSLAILGLLKWWGEMYPYRRLVICSRLSLGVISCLLSFVDAGEGTQELVTQGQTVALGGSAIWSLASHSMIIPIFAILLAAEQVAEFTIAYRFSVRRESNFIEKGPGLV